MAYITKKSDKPEMLGDIGFKLEEKLEEKPEYIKKKEKKIEYIKKKEKKVEYITIKPKKATDWITKKEYPIIGKDY